MEVQAPQPAVAQPDPAPAGDPPKRRRRITSKAALLKEAEKQFMDASPETLQEYHRGIGLALKRGDKWAFELVARLYYNDKGPGGVSITQQTLNVSAAAEKDAGPKGGYDSIIRMLEVRDTAVKQPGPMLVESKRLNQDVVDAELVAP